MRRLAMLLLVALPLIPARAEALTLKEIVELHRAGLADDVLVALIEVNKAIYSLEPETLKDLKTQGLSDRLLIAIINSGRTGLPAPPVPVHAPERAADPAAPQVVVIEHHGPPAPQVIVQQVPVYVAVPVRQPRAREVHVERVVTPASPFYYGQVREAEPRKAPEPEYWGFGGKLRPDAWQPPKNQVREKKETGDRK